MTARRVSQDRFRAGPARHGPDLSLAVHYARGYLACTARKLALLPRLHTYPDLYIQFKSREVTDEMT